MVIAYAPSFIKLFVPTEFFEKILPGTAYTSLPCSSPKSAVIKLPLFSEASITIILSDNPLIILFLAGKLYFIAFVPITYSETINPSFSKILLNILLFCSGYRSLSATPVPNTAIVFPILLSNAPKCAYLSIPNS